MRGLYSRPKKASFEYMKLTWIPAFLLLFTSSFLFAQEASTSYQMGDVIQDFQLPSVSGKDVSLQDYADEKGIIVIFCSNTCPYVKLYEERMIELHTTFATKGYPVLAICSNDVGRSPGNSFEKMKEYHAELDFPFDYIRDADQSILHQFGATRTPEVFLLQRSGKAFHLRYQGAIDDSPRNSKNVEEKFLESAIAALEKGQAPDPAKTKAIGCGIRGPK